MKTKKVIILGGGGNASVIGFAMIDAFNKGYNELEFIGYLNDRDKVTEIEGYPVLGGLKDIPELLRKDYYFINAIGKIGAQQERIALIESLKIPDNRYVTFIHPSAYVAPNVKLGTGCIIMPNVSISPGTSLGKCCRVMIGAVIGHNNNIGRYCFFAAASCTGAYITVGEGVFISLNATIREFIKIGNYSTIGMGAVVLNSIGENEIWVGNPAKVLNKN